MEPRVVAEVRRDSMGTNGTPWRCSVPRRPGCCACPRCCPRSAAPPLRARLGSGSASAGGAMLQRYIISSFIISSSQFCCPSIRFASRPRAASAPSRLSRCARNSVVSSCVVASACPTSLQNDSHFEICCTRFQCSCALNGIISPIVSGSSVSARAQPSRSTFSRAMWTAASSASRNSKCPGCPGHIAVDTVVIPALVTTARCAPLTHSRA
mmetsp:Transcript_83351/g.214653  ORF Transcript_83351/g.214653 Transcript_83351/m.214653 type:complete len:211 (+) Transcript_83351:656-1288(+)